MSVYTSVSRAELQAWLTDLPVGPLESSQGISAGIENTNYFVDTSGGRYVLTLFEALHGQALDFYLQLQARLAAAGFPCPRPLAFPDGSLQRPLAGKPAALLTRLPGAPREAVQAAHCLRIGRKLARFHQLCRALPDAPAHTRGPDWRRTTAARLASHLDPARQQLLEQALALDAGLPWKDLERGLIHADLFRDNVLWDGEQLGGLLDFYFAGTEVLLFDLAVTANDWCLAPSGRPEAGLEQALLAGYGEIRPLSAAERQHWPAMLAVAALRFWLSRLEVALAPRSGELVTLKDPEDFRRLLACRLAACPS